MEMELNFQEINCDNEELEENEKLEEENEESESELEEENEELEELEFEEEEICEDEQRLYYMYKIVPKNDQLKFCYVGHTSNFAQRMHQHKTNTTNVKDKKHYHLKHYDIIRQNGGWDEWTMEVIEQIYCKTKLEARMREQKWIDEYGANLNSLKAYITEEDRLALKRQITQKYRVENKEYLKEQVKNYKNENKEVIAQQMKKYRSENKEAIYQKSKEYKENNKEKFQEWDKVWREKNKDILKEKRKIYEAKKKAERPLPPPKIVKTEEEKALEKQAKRDQYNENRRLKRLQDKTV